MHTDSIEPFMAVTKEMELRFSFGYTPAEFAATLPAWPTAYPAPTTRHVGRRPGRCAPAPSRRCAPRANTARSCVP